MYIALAATGVLAGKWLISSVQSNGSYCISWFLNTPEGIEFEFQFEVKLLNTEANI